MDKKFAAQQQCETCVNFDLCKYYDDYQKAMELSYELQKHNFPDIIGFQPQCALYKSDDSQTMEDIFNAMTDEQKKVVYWLIDRTIEEYGFTSIIRQLEED